VKNAIMKWLRELNNMVGQKSMQDVAGEGAQKCPECGCTDIVKKDDEIYCKKCGFVMD